ncbi:MAG TPA: hypothetical protein VK095_04955 [Beutenbergiaceae bacterium]|nr:hypothetical protein [Beutenbergiaceae bacterium]
MAHHTQDQGEDPRFRAEAELHEGEQHLDRPTIRRRPGAQDPPGAAGTDGPSDEAAGTAGPSDERGPQQ